MDATDAAGYIAEREGAAVRPLRWEEASQGLGPDGAGGRVPFIRISDHGSSGRLAASGHAYMGHDNEGRMPFLCEWMQQRVLPLVDPGVDVRGCYRVELHDSYSYLPNRSEYADVLTFARPAGARERVGLIPDPYQVAGYGGALAVRDAVPWERKQPTLFFAGSTTGDRDPRHNARIRACVWALDHPDHARFRITQIVQMPPDAALACVPRLSDALGPHVPLPDHHHHRYQVNLAGNTACWSRVPMVMATQSLLLNVRHPDALWYYPLLREGEHYLGVDALDDLLRVRQACEADATGCVRMTRAANAFVHTHLLPQHAHAYMARFLEAAAWRGAP